MLEFENKNSYRKYPLKAATTNILPNDFIVNFSFTYLTESITTFRLGIKSITKTIKGSCIVIQDHNLNVLGCFNYVGDSIVNFESFDNKGTGVLTINNDVTSNYTFSTFADAEFEPTTIVVKAPPAVSSITKKTLTFETPLTGVVLTSLSNLTETIDETEIIFEVVDSSTIKSNNDIDATSQCRTPFITKINTVEPDENNNIDIITVLPLKVSMSGNTLTFETDTEFTKAELCTLSEPFIYA